MDDIVEYIQKYIPDEHHACTGTVQTKFKCGCVINMRQGQYGLFVRGYNPCFGHCNECQEIEQKDHDSIDYSITKNIHLAYHEIEAER